MSGGDMLCSHRVVEHDGIVTTINISFLPEEANAMITLHTFCSTSAYATNMRLHPKTCRELALVLAGIAAEYERHGGVL